MRKTIVVLMLFCFWVINCYAQQITPVVDKAAFRASIGQDNDEIVIGDEKSNNNFKPQVELNRWNKESSLTIEYDKAGFTNATLIDGKINSKNGTEEVNLYKIDDDNLEFEISLNEKPATNKWQFALSGWEEFNFFYQPALTQTEIDAGAIRPDNVIGSYAVYHKTKRNWQIGKTDYKTGKAFHIYRPKLTDADGKELWADLLIENGIMTITADSSWLDKAIYPVIIDPNIGYASIGATSIQLTDIGGNVIGMLDGVTLSSNGTLNNAYVYAYSGGPINAHVGVYVDSSGEPGALIANTTTQLSWTIYAPAAWSSKPISGNVVSGNKYWAMIMHTGYNSTLYYDTAGNSVRRNMTYGTWVDPFGAHTNDTKKWSVYVSYTETASEVTTLYSGTFYNATIY